jgi:hypothetical protein
VGARDSMDLFECQTITQIRMNAHGWLKIMLQPREKNARFRTFSGQSRVACAEDCN